MIVHVFNGRQIQLVPTISKGFISVYSSIAEPYIAIIGGSGENKRKYIELFKENSFNSYIFLSSLSQFSKFIRKVRKEAILFHGGKYEWHLTALLCGANNVSWVCWGYGSAIGDNWKSRLMTPIKKIICQRFRSIVTLMDEDKATIERDFHIMPDFIRVIPYASSGNHNIYDGLYDQLLEGQTHSSDKPLVLLGNSPREMHNYIEMLDRLSHLRGKIRVQCMNNYSLKHSELYDKLISKGRSVFGDDFKSNEDFHSDRADYIQYMNSCDIYVCSSESQTGLGAIGTCLRLGKKIYIHGKNLSWIRNHYHSLVFDSDEITGTISLDTLLSPLSIEEKKYNRDSIVKQRSVSVGLWEKYLREIDSVNVTTKR